MVENPNMCSAAGDGYFESFDYGESWKRPMAGLKHEYLVGLAVDPADPQTIIVSASGSPWQAHSRDDANSLVYRRSANKAKITTASTLKNNAKKPILCLKIKFLRHKEH
jgi:hypothetical protein